VQRRQIHPTSGDLTDGADASRPHFRSNLRVAAGSGRGRSPVSAGGRQLSTAQEFFPGDAICPPARADLHRGAPASSLIQREPETSGPKSVVDPTPAAQVTGGCLLLGRADGVSQSGAMPGAIRSRRKAHPDLPPRSGHGMPSWAYLVAVAGLLALLAIVLLAFRRTGAARTKAESSRFVSGDGLHEALSSSSVFKPPFDKEKSCLD
jgi:hypothetical protein